MKSMKAFWRAAEVIIISIGAGAIGNLIGSYIQTGNMTLFYIAIGFAIFLGVVLFLVYRYTPENLI